MATTRVLALASAVVVAAACDGPARDERPRPQDEPSFDAVDLVRMPGHALRACTRSRLLRSACPRLVPAARYDPRSGISDARVFRTKPGLPETFNLQSGGEDPRQPWRNRPPRMAHVVLVGATSTEAFEFGLEPGSSPREGLIRIPRRNGLALGRATWGGRSGRLVLAPPFPLGGIDGNHLVFLWRERSVRYRVSLHAWEPFPETVATLRRIVESIP